MNEKVKKSIKSWAGILSGCTIMAAGFVYFINPYNIVPGGTYGASIVLHNLVPKIQVGTFDYMFEIPLFILSFFLLGKNIGSKTIVASMASPLIMNVMSSLSYPTKQALHDLDPAQLLGGVLDLSDQLILATIIGATLIGLGCGIVVKNGATTGGTDIVGMIMQKYMNIRFSNAILIVDGIVVLTGLFIIGMHSGGEMVPLFLYSIIAIYISSRVVAMTLTGSKDDKIFFIISDRPLEPLKEFILKDLDRSATKIKSSGLYTGGDKEMIFLVVCYKEIQAVKQKVKEVDPSAFVVVTDAYDTYGEGWKNLPSAGDLQPE